MALSSQDCRRRLAAYDGAGSIAQTLLVAEHSSFRRAAGVLGVCPSVLSRRVRSLEDAIGVSLFERRSTGVRVTTAGRRFLNTGRSALAELGAAVRTAGSAGRGAEGCLHIGVLASLASMFAREATTAFGTRHPEVEVEIAEGAPMPRSSLWSGRVAAPAATGYPAIHSQGLRLG